ncbi:MAG: hypothetical protein ABIL09_14810 [Gemmatimonadota bacterium]
MNLSVLAVLVGTLGAVAGLAGVGLAAFGQRSARRLTAAVDARSAQALQLARRALNQVTAERRDRIRPDLRFLVLDGSDVGVFLVNAGRGRARRIAATVGLAENLEGPSLEAAQSARAMLEGLGDGLGSLSVGDRCLVTTDRSVASKVRVELAFEDEAGGSYLCRGPLDGLEEVDLDGAGPPPTAGPGAS